MSTRQRVVDTIAKLNKLSAIAAALFYDYNSLKSQLEAIKSEFLSDMESDIASHKDKLGDEAERHIPLYSEEYPGDSDDIFLPEVFVRIESVATAGTKAVTD